MSPENFGILPEYITVIEAISRIGTFHKVDDLIKEINQGKLPAYAKKQYEYSIGELLDKENCRLIRINSIHCVPGNNDLYHCVYSAPLAIVRWKRWKKTAWGEREHRPLSLKDMREHCTVQHRVMRWRRRTEQWRGRGIRQRSLWSLERAARWRLKAKAFSVGNCPGDFFEIADIRLKYLEVDRFIQAGKPVSAVPVKSRKSTMSDDVKAAYKKFQEAFNSVLSQNKKPTNKNIFLELQAMSYNDDELFVSTKGLADEHKFEYRETAIEYSTYKHWLTDLNK